MKKTFLMLIITFLLQSCYSYKQAEINPKTMSLGSVYKIERNDKTTKVVYTSNADSAIVVMKNGVEAITNILTSLLMKFRPSATNFSNSVSAKTVKY